MNIVPFEMKNLEAYYQGFNAEITKYQWPDPFETIDDARDLLKEFLDEMERGETLLYSIVSDDGKFVGSAEMHGIDGECPELGVWIIESEQGKGYAYKAICHMLDHAREHYGKSEFYYEADVRNVGSTKLLEKLGKTYEVTKKALEELTTESGKELQLQGYILKSPAGS